MPEHQKIILVTAYTDGSHGTQSVDIGWMQRIVGANANVELRAFNIFGGHINQPSDYHELMLGFDYTNLLNHVSMSLNRQIMRSDWARVGFFRFKPRLIKRALETSPAGSLIIWIDANQQKYPEYDTLLSSLVKNSCAILRDNDLLAFNESIASNFSIQCDSGRFNIPGLEEMRLFPIVWAGCFVVKNCFGSQRMVEEWDRLCSRTRNLIPMIISQKPIHKNLVVHAQEQVLLSIVVYSHLRGSPLYVETDYTAKIRMLLLPGSRHFPLRIRSHKAVLSSIIGILLLDTGYRAKFFMMQNLLRSVTTSLRMWEHRLRTHPAREVAHND